MRNSLYFPQDFKNRYCDEVLNTCVSLKGQLLEIEKQLEIVDKEITRLFKNMKVRINDLEETVKKMREENDS